MTNLTSALIDTGLATVFALGIAVSLILVGADPVIAFGIGVAAAATVITFV